MERMKIEKPTTVYFPEYRRSFRNVKCAICQLPGETTGEVVGHHLGHNKNRDDWLIGLCGRHHQGQPESVHTAPIEAAWWAEYCPDLARAAIEVSMESVFDENQCTFVGSDADLIVFAKESPDIVMHGIAIWCEKAHAEFSEKWAADHG